jgi:hypothetical protein
MITRLLTFCNRVPRSLFTASRRVFVGLLPVLLLPACFAIAQSAGQENHVLQADECGDPGQISQIYKVCAGRVVEVPDGDSLVIDLRGCEVKEVGQGVSDGQGSGKTLVQLVCLEAPPLSDPVGRIARENLADRLLGKVVKALDPTGAVRIRGEIWSARSSADGSIPVGAAVKVDQVDGLTLVVSENGR